MCRYAFNTYKSHYVCFDCRKTFKQYPVEDLIIRDGHWEQYRRAYNEPNRFKAEKYREENSAFVDLIDEKYFGRKYPCPQCSKEMTNMGMDFKAPKMSAVKEWTIIQSLHKLGHAFQTCGCDGPGFIPINKEDYIAYLDKRKRHYQNMLDHRADTQTEDDIKNYLNYWTSKIELVNAELKKVTTANII